MLTLQERDSKTFGKTVWKNGYKFNTYFKKSVFGVFGVQKILTWGSKKVMTPCFEGSKKP